MRLAHAAAFAAAGGLCGAVAACQPPLSGADVQSVEGSRYVLAFRPRPAPIEVGRHFALEIAVCAKDGAPASPALDVDAGMPEHRHGMNYRPSVSATGPGRYLAEGLMFHMPGRWEIVFELRAERVLERLARSVIIE